MIERTPRYIFLGGLTRDFIILPSGKTVIDQAGGDALYAAVGALVWDADESPGMVARIGEDYPQQWLEEFAQRGIETRGVVILPQAVDVRNFSMYLDLERYVKEEPIRHFSRVGAPLPHLLLGYEYDSTRLDSRTKLSDTTIRREDIHPDFMQCGVAHFCPMDYLSHSLLPALLRQAAFTTITLDPAPGYMNPSYFPDLPKIVTGLSAFIPSEKDLRFLFQGHSEDLWEMAEFIVRFGCELVVIKCGSRGQLLYDAAAQARWEIPAYPARVVDPNGAGSAFCGGFLVGYRKFYDPLEAVLYGNVAASLVVEGSGPFFALDALSGLAEARLASLRKMVQKV